MNKNGQNEIELFLTDSIDGTEMESWIKDLIKCKNEDYKKVIIECYKKTLNGDRNLHVTPFHEAISMLGIGIEIEENN